MSKEPLKSSINVLVWVCRIIVGGAFVFSAITKAVDPWGTIFKFEQYFSAWGVTEPRSLLLGLAILLCVCEFLLGISILTGIYRKISPWFILVFAGFFLILTGYIAIVSPIDDCGCFGDALKLSNWATFFKNIILVALIIVLLKFNDDVEGFFKPELQWLVALFSILYIFGVSLDGYLIQPPLDFRPFPIGTNLLEDFSSADTYFIYEKDGKQQEFSADALPSEESGWNFVGRKEAETKDSPLEIYDEEGDNIKDSVIPEDSEAVIFVIPEKDRLEISLSMYVNRIKAYADNQGIESFAVIGDATPENINQWKDLAMADYPVYSADETQLKQLSRGEMSIVTVDRGTIKNKFSLSMISNAGLQKLEKGEINLDDLPGFDSGRVFAWMSRIYILLLIILFFCSWFVPKKKEEQNEDSEAINED